MTLDGVLSDASYWATEGDGEWVAYTLSELTRVDTVRFAFFETSVRNFDVQVSEDGATWVNVLTGAASQGNNPNVFERFDLTPACARHLRFVGHGSDVSLWNAVVETDIQGFAIDLDPSSEEIIDPRVFWKETWSAWDLNDAIYDAEILAHWGPNASQQSILTAATETAEIIDFNGNRTLRAHYPEGECCYHVQGSSVTNTGTAVNLVLENSDGTWDYETIAVSFNLYLMPGFTMPKAYKLPGFSNRNPSTHDGGVGRVTVNEGSYFGKALVPSYYNYCWDCTSGTTNGRDFEIPTGEWINVTLMAATGTASSNGELRMYVNGVLNGGDGTWTPTPDYIDASHTWGWNTFELELNMGGGDDSYDAPIDEWILVDDVILWEPSAADFAGTDISSSIPVDASFGR